MAGRKFIGGFDCAKPGIKEEYKFLTQHGKPDDPVFMPPHIRLEADDIDWSLFWYIFGELSPDNYKPSIKCPGRIVPVELIDQDVFIHERADSKSKPSRFYDDALDWETKAMISKRVENLLNGWSK